MDALLRRLYALLLRCYPRAFRQAFGDEMQAVFAEALQARDRQPARVALRELLDLPAGLMAAWDWSLRHRGQPVPRFSLAPDGLPGGYTPIRPTPTPWAQALLAGLPFLLLGLLAGLPDLLSLPVDAPVLTITLLFPLVLAGAACLFWSLLRGWPRWAAGWYLIWLALLIYPFSLLVDINDNFYQAFLMIVFPLLIAWVLYRIARRDRITAVLAGLPAMLIVWLPFMEQTPRTIIPAPLRGATFLCLFVLSALAAVIFLRANRLELALGLALCASAAGGALAAYAGIYFGGSLSFSEPGPSPRAALEVFLPAFFLSASIALGPQLARSLRDLGLRAGKWGRWTYRLALLGLLLALVMAVLTYNSMTDDSIDWVLARILPAPLVSVLTGRVGWEIALGIYVAGFGWLALGAERAGVLPRAGILALLFLLPLGVPAGLIGSLRAYMGWILPLRWVLNVALLVWLAASVWLILQQARQVPANSTPPG